jgi:hypothetical protein
MSANGIATPDDFRKAAEATSPERVVLPKSGLAVLLRRPTTFGTWLLDQQIEELRNAEKFLELRDLMRDSVEKAFVQPKLSINPGPNEIHPSWLPQEDQDFILRWVRGWIAPDGTDLVEKFFRPRSLGASASAAGASPDSGDLALPPERTPGAEQ